MNTVTRAQLAEQIYMQVGLSRNESAELLEHVLERVALRLERGESVKISGFGTLSVRQKGRRIGRNPKTGVEVPILPRCVLVFRPSQVMKARINGENPPPEGDEFGDDESEDELGDELAEDELDEACDPEDGHPEERHR